MNEKRNLKVAHIGIAAHSLGMALAKTGAENNHVVTEQPPLILPDQRILDMRGNPITKKGPTPSEIRAKKQHDIAEAKIQELVLEYFRVSKDDKPGSGTYFNKFNNQWKVFATIKNKQQRDVTLHLNAFEENVKVFMEHADNLVRQRQEESNNPTTEDQK